MKELLRRLMLAAAFVVASLYFWYTPDALVAVRVMDWETEFSRSVKRSRLLPGSSFRRHAGAKSAAALRRQQLEKHRLPEVPTLSESWIGELKLPASRAGRLRERQQGDLFYFHADEHPATELQAPLRHKWTATGTRNAYASVGNDDLEFLLVPNPRGSDAPATAKYPLRSTAYPIVLAGLCLYALFGLRLTPGAHYDPVPTTVLDLVAVTGVALLVGLPLWLAPSTKGALEDPGGGILWFWPLALVPLGLLLAMARRAAFRVLATPQRLQLSGMWRSRFVPWGQIRSVVPPPLDDASAPLQVQLQSGEQLQVPWLGLRDMLPVVQRMQHCGLLTMQPPFTSRED